MGNKRVVEGGSALHAGERKGRRSREGRPIPPLTSNFGLARVKPEGKAAYFANDRSGYAVVPLALRMTHGGKYTEYPLTVESALAIASDLTKMALWEMRKR